MKIYVHSMWPQKILPVLHCIAALALTAFLQGCGTTSDDSTAPQTLPADSLCDSACDSSPLSIPVLHSTGGYGAVTTYGDVASPQPSTGGACNYGPTQILDFAAAHVHLAPGDAQGLWNGGHACGDCYRVRTGSDSGWRSVVVRIVDKCPDAYCGIDLGGAPAQTLMGKQPGRYTGEWEWTPCDGAPHVSDGPAVLHVKEGSNAWWAIVQVRNGPSSVQSIQWKTRAGTSGEFAWASEAENYFKVPPDLLAQTDTLQILIKFRTGTLATLPLPGTSLGKENSDYLLE